MKKIIISSSILLVLSFVFGFQNKVMQNGICPNSKFKADKYGFTHLCLPEVSQSQFISKRLIRYTFLNKPKNLDFNKTKAEIKKAFSTWNKATGIGFKEVSNLESYDMTFDWQNRDSDERFKGNQNILAYANINCKQSVLGNGIRFCNNHVWTLSGENGKKDLQTVALHEIGHILGFSHNTKNNSVMYPEIGNVPQIELTYYDKIYASILYPGDYFSKADNMRGFSWNNFDSKTSYIYWDYREKKSMLLLRNYSSKENIFYGSISKYIFSTGDNVRGWSWDKKYNLASYIIYSNSTKKSTLYIRSFNGKSFGKVSKTIVMGSSDNFLGWSWDKGSNTASYLANIGGKTYLFVRYFNGKKFGKVKKKILMSSRSGFRAWNWDKSYNYANYFSYVKDGRNTLMFNKTFNGYKFN